MITNRDIVFASLMGSNAVGTIQRTNVVQNELQKHILPAIPFLPVEDKLTTVRSKNMFVSSQNGVADESLSEDQQFFPLSFSFTSDGQKWLFPYEPMVNISSGNNVVMRNVAKQGDQLIGTVKERWSRKDFDIQVTGVLMGSQLQGSAGDTFPRKQMEALFEFLKFSKEIFVYCHPLEILGITKVVVLDYSFPFTKGENVQAYDIKLVSDFSYNLLIKEETF